MINGHNPEAKRSEASSSEGGINATEVTTSSGCFVMGLSPFCLPRITQLYPSPCIYSKSIQTKSTILLLPFIFP